MWDNRADRQTAPARFPHPPNINRVPTSAFPSARLDPRQNAAPAQTNPSWVRTTGHPANNLTAPRQDSVTPSLTTVGCVLAKGSRHLLSTVGLRSWRRWTSSSGLLFRSPILSAAHPPSAVCRSPFTVGFTTKKKSICCMRIIDRPAPSPPSPVPRASGGRKNWPPACKGEI